MNQLKYIILCILAVNSLLCGIHRHTHAEAPNPSSPSQVTTPRAINKKLSKPLMCVRSGTYEVTSNDTFYLADLDGNLPPVNQRKVSVDILDDCKSHIMFNERFSVHVKNRKADIEFSKDSLGDFKISQTKINDCILEFDIHNQGEPYMLARATFIIDYSEKKPTAQAKNIWFLTKLDGELGEHMVSCAADSATLLLTSAQPIHRE